MTAPLEIRTTDNGDSLVQLVGMWQLLARVGLLAASLQIELAQLRGPVQPLVVVPGAMRFASELLVALQRSVGMRAAECAMPDTERPHYTWTSCPRSRLEHTHALVISDVIRTGLTIRRLDQWLEKSGTLSRWYVTLADRSGKRTEPLELRTRSVLEVPGDSCYLVGHGLRTGCGEHAELPGVWELKPLVV